MQNRGRINAFWLKIVMLVLMTLDHIYYFNLFPGKLLWAHYASRVVAPVFCYLMTEGMLYTRNRRRYILRMLTFGAGMLAGNLILYSIFGKLITNSIILSLTIGAAVIVCIDRALTDKGGRRALWVLAVVGLFAASTFVEGGFLIPVMAVVFYYQHRRPVVMWLAFFIILCVPYLVTWMEAGTLEVQFWMILSIIPIALYNGTRGFSGPVAKYLFYIYYPLHIWVIFLMKQLLPAFGAK